VINLLLLRDASLKQTQTDGRGTFAARKVRHWPNATDKITKTRTSAWACAVDRLISLYGEGVNISQLQDIIERTYGERDRARGVPSTVAWLAEEVGELAQAVRKGNLAQQEHEFGDVLAWVATLANQMGVDLDKCVARYANGCPTCSTLPCTC